MRKLVQRKPSKPLDGINNRLIKEQKKVIEAVENVEDVEPKDKKRLGRPPKGEK